MTAQVAADLRGVVNVLSEHYRVATGLSYGSADECACGTKTRPLSGDEDVTQRRARAFAEHQATEVIAALRAAADRAEAEQ